MPIGATGPLLLPLLLLHPFMQSHKIIGITDVNGVLNKVPYPAVSGERYSLTPHGLILCCVTIVSLNVNNPVYAVHVSTDIENVMARYIAVCLE